MKFESLVKPAVLTQPVYEPGKPIEEVARELGLDPAGIIKLASNENPFGPSPKALLAAQRALLHGELYPDGGCFALRQSSRRSAGSGGPVHHRQRLQRDHRVSGPRAARPGDEVVMGAPAFVVYKLVTLVFGAKAVEVPLTNHRHDLARIAAAVTRGRSWFTCAARTTRQARRTPAAELLAFARALPDHVVAVFDEAYADYVADAPDLRPLIREGRKVVCLRTFSKIYGLAALRVGYGYATATSSRCSTACASRST